MKRERPKSYFASRQFNSSGHTPSPDIPVGKPLVNPCFSVLRLEHSWYRKTSEWRIATFGQNKPHKNDWVKIKINVLNSKSNFFELASASSQGFGEG